MSSPTKSPTLRHFLPKRKSKRSHHVSLEDHLFGEPFNPTLPEQAIWRAVILQMMTDALSTSRKRETVRHRREAYAWLNGNSRDFRTVCDFAGFDPDYIRERVQALLSDYHTISGRAAPSKDTPPPAKHDQPCHAMLLPSSSPHVTMRFGGASITIHPTNTELTP